MLAPSSSRIWNIRLNTGKYNRCWAIHNFQTSSLSLELTILRSDVLYKILGKTGYDHKQSQIADKPKSQRTYTITRLTKAKQPTFSSSAK